MSGDRPGRLSLRLHASQWRAVLVFAIGVVGLALLAIWVVLGL